MINLRLREFGNPDWTYVSADGPAENRLIQDWLTLYREDNDGPDLHIQQWDDEEWFDVN